MGTDTSIVTAGAPFELPERSDLVPTPDAELLARELGVLVRTTAAVAFDPVAADTVVAFARCVCEPPQPASALPARLAAKNTAAVLATP